MLGSVLEVEQRICKKLTSQNAFKDYLLDTFLLKHEAMDEGEKATN